MPAMTALAPPLRRFPVNVVDFHECLNGDLNKIAGGSAHLLVRNAWLLLWSQVRFFSFWFT